MNLQEIIEKVYENPLFQGVVAAVFGGLTRAVADWKKQFKLKTLLAGLVTAAYVGAVVVFVSVYYKVDPILRIILCLACGLAHVELVILIRQKILKKIKESDKYE